MLRRSARLIRFIEHRVANTRVVRLIKKWLHAGVLEEGRLTRSEVETIQGGSISPLLSNICLHYAFNLWVKQWRVRHAVGDMMVVRYADDWVDTDFFLPVVVQIGHMLVLAGHAARAGRLFAGVDAVAALS
ncbi:reverse transcriptase domain-containing protein, partial [Burkholderia ubonensis]